MVSIGDWILVRQWGNRGDWDYDMVASEHLRRQCEQNEISWKGPFDTEQEALSALSQEVYVVEEIETA